MESIFKLSQNIIDGMSEEISKICSPLRELNIVFFTYYRLYSDGSFIYLSDNYDYSNYFLNKNAHEYLNNFNVGFSLTSATLLKKNSLNVLKDLDVAIDINDIIILKEDCNNYNELWNFGFTKKNKYVNNIFPDNLDMLKSFSFHFKEHAYKIIKKLENNRKTKLRKNIFVPLQKKDLVTTHLKNIFYTKLQISKFYLGQGFHDTYLTYQEFICIYWCAHGKSSKEISIILGISSRTVETYLEKVKEKLLCYKNSELIYKVTKSGILEIDPSKIRSNTLIN